MTLNVHYIKDPKGNNKAVQMDVKTFQQIEQLLEDYALGQYIIENKEEQSFSLEEAEAYYKTIQKKTK